MVERSGGGLEFRPSKVMPNARECSALTAQPSASKASRRDRLSIRWQRRIDRLRSDPQERQLKIISGGQTGVDRAALDAALASGVPCGGWCPAGRKAEDGRISDRYPLAELPGGDYRERTFKNVESSDASLIIAFGKPSGGTAQAVDFCRRLNKPFLVVDATAISVEEALSQALAFLGERKVTRLNVAGPRASSDARGYGFTFDLVNRLLARVP